MFPEVVDSMKSRPAAGAGAGRGLPGRLGIAWANGPRVLQRDRDQSVRV